MPSKKTLDWADKKNGKINIIQDPKKAVAGVDAIMSDKWISMGDKVNVKQKKKALKDYQVNKKMMSLASKHAIFMHVLSDASGEVVSAEILDVKQLVTWQQQDKNMHGIDAIIE